MLFYEVIDALTRLEDTIKNHKIMNSNISRVLYTQKEIAAMMGVSLVTVRRWQKLGCPVVRVGIKTESHGCRTRLDVDDVKAWLKARSNGGACGDMQGAESAAGADVHCDKKGVMTFEEATRRVLA